MVTVKVRVKVFFYTFHTFWNVGLSVFKKRRKKRGKNYILIYKMMFYYQ